MARLVCNLATTSGKIEERRYICMLPDDQKVVDLGGLGPKKNHASYRRDGGHAPDGQRPEPHSSV